MTIGGPSPGCRVPAGTYTQETPSSIISDDAEALWRRACPADVTRLSIAPCLPPRTGAVRPRGRSPGPGRSRLPAEHIPRIHGDARALVADSGTSLTRTAEVTQA
ncbi:hypothetical protein GCM10022254_66130 [Actinomadura meridiana]|uniref:Uncharacterized protein n=1 Tax=Actinomadura meridiana TaxID=559626 RepID=A0ABP8CL29_9ACTN